MIVFCITVELLFMFIGNIEKAGRYKIKYKGYKFPDVEERGPIQCVILIVKL